MQIKSLAKFNNRVNDILFNFVLAKKVGTDH